MSSRTREYNMEPLAMVLLAVAVLLGAFIFLQIARFLVGAAEAETTVAKITHSAVVQTDAAHGQGTQVASAVEKLKKKNLFASPGEKRNPVNEVIGILGDQALINGQWYKAGDSVGDAKVVAVEPTRVRIAWNGQEKEFMPIGSSGSEASGGPDRARRGGSPRPAGSPAPPGAAPRAVASSGPGAMPPGGLAGMSPEERDRLRERWATMSPEERERTRSELRERSGGRDR